MKFIVDNTFILLLTAILFSSFSFASAQKIPVRNSNGLGGFHLKSISGNVFLWGDYRFQTNTLKSGFREEQKSSAFSGEINLNSTSYLLHPNFLLIDLGFGYAPGIIKNNYLVAPDRTDSQTAEKLNFGLTFFNQRPFSINTFANYSHNFINRELSSDVESFRFNAGSAIAYKNKVLPISINLKHDWWKQNELLTKRVYESKQNSISGKIVKSFAHLDRNELETGYDDYSRKYGINSVIRNESFKVIMRNRFYLNSDHRDHYQSYIWYQNQKGDQLIKRFLTNQELHREILTNLHIRLRGQYSKLKYNMIDTRQYYGFGELSHQLYRSVRTFVNFDYSDSKQTYFDEAIKKVQTGFDYRKQIPTGSLQLSYSYLYQSSDRNATPTNLVIINEEHNLVDGDIILLNNPGVLMTTVKVTDLTETIIYDADVDYTLIQRGAFVEIMRIPGGQITNGDVVLVDYESENNPSYNYNATGNRIRISVSAINNLLDIYFGYNDFNYSDIEGGDLNIFKYFNQRLCGLRLQYEFITAGFELDDFNSNITPYQSLRYYADISNIFFNRLMVGISASYQDYNLVQSDEKYIYKLGTGRISYMFSSRTKFSFTVNSRLQRGNTIDLNLYSIRTELETQFRNIIMVLGYQNFYRDFLGEKVNYNNLYLRIGRRF